MVKEHISPEIAKGKRIYAIGDVHGKVHLLLKICDLIYEDAQKHHDDVQLIFMGDYIDRGEDSKGVIDIILSLIDADINVVALMGNHEHSLKRFLKNGEKHNEWLMWGGSETLRSYGVKFSKPNGKPYPFDELSEQLAEKMPKKHRKFLKQLKLYHEEGDYVFVHAGLRPNVALEDQTKKDLLRIRKDFVDEDVTVNKTIVFGHTIFDEPFESVGKIGVDRGSYRTGKLGCVVLYEDKRYFLCVESE